MVREKDEALGKDCRRVLDAAGEALGWVADNAKLVGPARAGIERALKRNIVEARRLGTAAVRPMSAAVFGPSQAGKSFLIGKFITPPGRPAMAVFGSGAEQEKLDFLTQVNPQGGKETTGLVTRFTLKPVATPPGFPVVLRLLREVDLIKILANSFLFDLSGTYETRAPLAATWVGRLVEEMERAAAPAPVGGLGTEDVLELRDYMEVSLAPHPYVQLADVGEAYWPAMERLLPRLAGEARVRALSPLWGALPEFDRLYAELKQALDLLGHPAEAFAPMEAIRDTAAGILHVDRIYELSQTDGPGAHPVRLAVGGGAPVTLRTSVVTALTLELRVTLDTAPWPFLDHTDLLDFPGARSREASTVERYLRRPYKAGAEKPPREYCFLRGKVATLFDNYVADLDLNTMMLCIPDSNLEVRKLPELVEGWVGKTHGASPADRAGRANSLLFCMTKCDRMFDLSAGASLAQQVENRFRTNFDDFPGWTREWHPGRPFDNTFLLRNPKAVEQPNVFVYHGPPADRVVRDETALTTDFKDRLLPAFRQSLDENRTVQTHVGDLDRKVEALLALNDGGTSYLAQALSPVCDPDLKHAQIQPRLRLLASETEAMLAAYHDDDDIEQRVTRRIERAKAAIRAMVGTVNPPLGLLIAELCVDEAALRQAYLEFARRDRASADGPVAPVAAGPASDEFGIDLDALDLGPPDPGQPRAAKPAPPARPRESYGRAAVGRWLDGLLRKTADSTLTSRFGLTPEQFQVFVEELEGGGRRLRVAERIDRHTDRVIAYRQPLASTAAAVALGATVIINDFVADAGRRLMEEDPDPDQAARARAAFTPPPQLAPGDMPDLPVDEAGASAARRNYPTEWARAFLTLTRENASSSDGVLVDPEQNGRLGRILKALRV